MTLITANSAISLLEDAAAVVCENGDVAELARWHVRLDEFRRRISDVARMVEQQLAEVMPDQRLELPGMPILERRSGVDRRRWQSDELLDRCVRIAVDPDGTGELPPPAELLDRVTSTIRRVMPITGSLAWRVTGLRELGLDPDEWCETSPGRVTVQIHGGDG